MPVNAKWLIDCASTFTIMKLDEQINRSINGPPALSEKLVCQEETACEGDKEVAEH